MPTYLYTQDPEDPLAVILVVSGDITDVYSALTPRQTARLLRAAARDVIAIGRGEQQP